MNDLTSQWSWRPWRHFTQQSAAIWWAHTQRRRASCSSVRQFLIYSTFLLVNSCYNGNWLCLVRNGCKRENPLHQFSPRKSTTSPQRKRQVREKLTRAKVRCVCCVVSFHKFHYNDLLRLRGSYGKTGIMDFGVYWATAKLVRNALCSAGIGAAAVTLNVVIGMAICPLISTPDVPSMLVFYIHLYFIPQIKSSQQKNRKTYTDKCKKWQWTTSFMHINFIRNVSAHKHAWCAVRAVLFLSKRHKQH